jgi:hypothetical protein
MTNKEILLAVAEKLTRHDRPLALSRAKAVSARATVVGEPVCVMVPCVARPPHNPPTL